MTLTKVAARIALGWRGFVMPLALIALAEGVSIANHLESDSIARPSEVAAAGVEALLDGSIFMATYQTLRAAIAGLAIGCSIGLGLGILVGLSSAVNRLLEFSIESLRPIPSVALIPVAMLIFGFGYGMEIMLVAVATCWPTLILTRAAIGGIEPRLMEVARVLGLGQFARVRKIILPAALPRLFIAFRLAVGIALIVSVTCEIAANPLGLGHAMMTAQQSLHPDLGLAFLCWLGFVGWSLNAGLLWAQRRFFGPAAVVEAQP